MPGDQQDRPVDDEPPDREASPTLAERKLQERWMAVRGILLVISAVAVLTKHEALAVGTRAFVEIGDAIWSLPQR